MKVPQMNIEQRTLNSEHFPLSGNPLGHNSPHIPTMENADEVEQ